MNLGFIGTGKIASSVITGVCKSKIKYKKILISERNKKIAKNLKQKFKKISISKNNQEIVDKCDWVFLSVTPTVGEKIIKDLKFRSTQTVISFISTITLSQLKKMINVRAKIVRAIPLPPISLKKGPVPYLST
jgi:pyrroline-5-carboxylate reductase